MAYRDETQALRARLEATEQRLRVVENELADARRQLEEPAPLGPSQPPPASRRVGYPPLKRTSTFVFDAFMEGVTGIVLLLAGVGYLLWNLPADDGPVEMLETFGLGMGVAIVPGFLIIRWALRPRPLPEPVPIHDTGIRTRVAPPRRVEVTPLPTSEVSGREDDVDLDGDVFGVELRTQHVAERRS